MSFAEVIYTGLEMKTLYSKWKNSNHTTVSNVYFLDFIFSSLQTDVPYILSYCRWESVVPLLVKHEEVMSHTELLFRVNIHWLLVIHSYDVRTIETFTHKILLFFSPPKQEYSLYF